MKKQGARAALFLCCIAYGVSQTPPPLELPEVVIVGQEERRIPGGSKQPAQPPAPFSAALLDSLNPLAKHTVVGAVPIPDFPNRIVLEPPLRAYVEGGIGQYTSGYVSAFYQHQRDARRFVIRGYAASTAGHVAEADSVGVSGIVQYAAPIPSLEWLQNATGQGTVHIHWHRYRLFGDSVPWSRSLLELLASGEIQGVIGELQTRAEMTVGVARLRHDVAAQSEQRLGVRFRAEYPLQERYTSIGAEGHFDVRFWGEQLQSLGELALRAMWQDSSASARGSAGLQLARAYTGAGFLTPSLEGEVQYAVMPNGRAILGVWSRLQAPGVWELWRENPYASPVSVPLPVYERVGVRGAFQWSPAPRWSIEPAVWLRSVGRWWTWERDSIGFRLRVGAFRAVELSCDVLLYFSERHFLGSTLRIGKARFESEGHAPYYVPASVTFRYDRWWREGLWSSLGMEVVSSRWVSLRDTLPGFVRVWGEIRYQLMQHLLLALYVDNALNADIQRWSGYPERGIFIGATARWSW